MPQGSALSENATRSLDGQWSFLLRSTTLPVGPRLAQFHLRIGDKFENGDFADVGETRRRQILVESVGLIGKESNKVGASGEVDPISSV